MFTSFSAALTGLAANEVGVDSLLNVPGPGNHSDSDARVSELLHGLIGIGLSPREMECVRLKRNIS